MASQTGRVRSAGGRTRRVAVVCVVGALVTVAGCSKGGSNEADAGASSVVASPSGVASASSAVSTPSVLPSSPVSATPSDQQLYDEAVQVLQRVNQVTNDLERTGGFPAGANPPKGFGEVMMGAAYEAKVKYFNNMYRMKGRAASGEGRLLLMQRHAPNKDAALVAIRYCDDASTVVFKQQDGKSFKGTSMIAVAYFKRDGDGRLKKSWGTKEREVTSCAAA